MEGEAFLVEWRRRKLDVEEGHAFIFILPRHKTLTSFLCKERERMVGAGLILGHLAPVKLLLMIGSILKSAFSANT